MYVRVYICMCVCILVCQTFENLIWFIKYSLVLLFLDLIFEDTEDYEIYLKIE